MRRALPICLAVALAGCGTPPAGAAMLKIGDCLGRDRLAEILRSEAGQVPVSRMLTFDGYMAEIFVAPGGTWTAVTTDPHHVSCITDAGEGFRPVGPAEGTPL